MLCELELPRVLLHEGKIVSLQHLLPVLEDIARDHCALFIVAEEVEGEALATLVVNKLRGGLKVAAVKAPGFGERRRALMDDLAALVGATVVRETSRSSIAASRPSRPSIKRSASAASPSRSSRR